MAQAFRLAPIFYVVDGDVINFIVYAGIVRMSVRTHYAREMIKT